MKKKFAILIVDDDADLASNLQDILEAEGYDTLMANDGQRALTLCGEKAFDLAIIDIRLPDMIGIELIAPFKKAHPDMVVIIITAYAAVETAVWALNNGATAYITKPFNMDKVLATVKEVLEKQRLMIESKRLYRATQRQLAERTKVVKALMESERGLLEIFNSLDDLVLMIDTEYNVIQANRSVGELLNKPAKNIVGQKCYKLLHDSNEPLANYPTAKCLETVSVETMEYYEPKFNKYLLAKATPILDKDNKIMAILYVLRDITEHKKAEEQLEKDYETMVVSLAFALEARDPYTKGHSDRVKRYCRAIASQMGLPTKQIQELERAASLHDIGKIAIPDAILGKPGRLTPPEFAQIQQHPEKSIDLIRLLPNPQNTLLAIRHHHERTDGKGYPDGLSNDNIPFEARILAVADAYDALTSERPYRTGFTHEEALRILKEKAGTQWDAKVVKAAIEALGK